MNVSGKIKLDWKFILNVQAGISRTYMYGKILHDKIAT